MRHKIAFKHNPWPFNPTYPKAWRGSTEAIALIGTTAIRLQLAYVKRENDWQRVDTATRINISPAWAKWFHFCSYYAGHYRNIYHLSIGRLCLSILPHHKTVQEVM